MAGFSDRATEQGATLWRNEEVTAIHVDERGVSGIETSRGPVATRVVVNAAGAWAAQVAKLAGVDLPVEPFRRMLVPSEPFDEFPHSAPMVVYLSTRFHFLPEGRRFLLAWNDHEETSSFNTAFDNSFIE